MSTMLEHARRELKILEKGQEENAQLLERNYKIEVLVAAVEANVAGMDGGERDDFLTILGQLIKGAPVTPLTGEESEWLRIAVGTDQNLRMTSVMRAAGDNATAYDLNKPFEDRKVTFPYNP